MTEPSVRADEQVAARFSRAMRAATSPWGVLTDPPIVSLSTAVGVMAMLGAMQAEVMGPLLLATQVLAAAPLAIAVLATLALSGARKRVVAWLAGLPFPVENINALLNGVGESLEVRFEDAPPAAEALNPLLDAVHTDTFVTDVLEEPRVVEIRIGVVDSKRNPAASNHRRWVRVQQIVERVLVPLSAGRPIRSVYVK